MDPNMCKSYRHPAFSEMLPVGYHQKFSFLILLLAVLCLTSLQPVNAATPLLIDDFTNPAVWIPKNIASAPPIMVPSGSWGAQPAMKFPCDQSLIPDKGRCYWDRTVSLDLSGHLMLALDIYIPDANAFSSITLYMHSGTGWYLITPLIKQTGWQTLNINIPRMNIQDTPAGFNVIDTIRLSPWKQAGSVANTYIALGELRAYTPAINIVDGGFTNNIERMFDLYNIPYGNMSYTEVETGYLSDTSMVILPEGIPSVTSVDQIETFVNAGGKIMATATALWAPDNRLAKILGIKADTVGAIANLYGYSLSDTVIQQLPVSVGETRWGWTTQWVPDSVTVDPARIIAKWDYTNGTPSIYPAWTANNTGLYTSQVPLYSDIENKAYMMAALIGHYVPATLPATIDTSIQRAGKIGEYANYIEAVDAIRAKGLLSPRAVQIETALVSADTNMTNALLGQTVNQLHDAWLVRPDMQLAYALAQSPATGDEYRAVWEHSGIGPYAGDWATSIDVLVNNGFNAVYPNMVWGGLAYYQTSLIPMADEVTLYGDQISAVVNAAHARNVQAHIWKITWNLNKAPQAFVDDMVAQNRVLLNEKLNIPLDANGNPVVWLSPCNAANRQLEKSVILEIANNYNVDGIHLDYIRFLHGFAFFDNSCKTRFELETSQTVTNWPADVLAGGALNASFDAWRPTIISSFVKDIHDALQAINAENRPGKRNIKLSAAVFRNYPDSPVSVGQDWVQWMNDGYIDMLHPMDYADNLTDFNNYIDNQLKRRTRNIPIYPGIGSHATSNDGVIAQILATRNHKTNGFIVFNYNRTLVNNYLPKISAGATHPDPDADGVLINIDNCPTVANANQANLDGDVLGDACDAFITDPTEWLDTDGDGTGNNTDADDDGDGLLDINETNTGVYVSPSDAGTNPLIADTDGDGVNDGIEVAAGTNPLLNTSTPVINDGDANGDGLINTADLFLAMKILTGLRAPDLVELAHLDVAPVVSGSPSPDGQFNVSDYVVLIKKVIGL
jgi:uncharacterized lipoprotein YddW (UPF0748 family)